ncbi:2',3'-cyclic-nucleotide 3'-phosphodiesterase, partial [Hysterangium stoloniferum]
GTSLWLVPSASSPTREKLQDLLLSLSKSYSSPSFPVHITLAGLPACISLHEIITCLSSEEAVKITFQDVCTGKTFFQSVFIAIQQSVQLSHLHEHVHKTLGVQPKTPEFPHLSLYYGDNHKQEIVQMLRENGTIQASTKGGIAVAGVDEFLAEEVWVVECIGKPEDWVVKEKIYLGGEPSTEL